MNDKAVQQMQAKRDHAQARAKHLDDLGEYRDAEKCRVAATVYQECIEIVEHEG